MKLSLHAYDLQLINPWKIASSQGSSVHSVVLFELTDNDGLTGIGEGAPSWTYQETVKDVMDFCSRLDISNLSFANVNTAMEQLRSLPDIPAAVLCGLDLALLDGAAKRDSMPVYDYFKLGFRERHHVTSFSIGIDSPAVVREKVAAAHSYPILKLKVGAPNDRENLVALRSVAPTKPIRVDANEAWQTKEQALKMLESLAADGHIQFVEQPMPRNTPAADLVWLKERSPLPLFADESCHTVRDIAHCAECFHGVNVKLVKAGGLSMAHHTLRAARQSGLQTMIGCMIETSVAISAAAHLAELADYLDLDGNLLIKNDPYTGVTAENGILSFESAHEIAGLRVTKRA